MLKTPSGGGGRGFSAVRFVRSILSCAAKKQPQKKEGKGGKTHDPSLAAAVISVKASYWMA
jgi:hypothetical protein